MSALANDIAHDIHEEHALDHDHEHHEDHSDHDDHDDHDEHEDHEDHEVDVALGMQADEPVQRVHAGVEATPKQKQGFSQ